jgi:predicted SAM-dependent methyltransferase
MKLLNLGCGGRFRPDWINLDLASIGVGVLACDLRKGIPFPDASFDVVYHSHVLEHFSSREGLELLKSCYRVLRPGGRIRVAVPDLERIARLYLEGLEKSTVGDAIWQQRYEWIFLEMYDQTVREFSGGGMLEYLRREPVPECEFVEARLGGEFRGLTRRSAPQNLTNRGRILKVWKGWLSRKMARLVLGREGLRAYDIGIFRNSGEVHRWMYDRYSLARILTESGFASPKQMGPAESGITGWTDFHLDTEPNGEIYKPDSLYMEATRP